MRWMPRAAYVNAHIVLQMDLNLALGRDRYQHTGSPMREDL